MKDKLETLFWKIAIRIIRKGYGDCVDLEESDRDDGCAGCRAGNIIRWIEDHISLIRS